MRLEGIHHITAITGDAPGNVDFYVRVLGLRMVKKTVNFDLPDVYHLYYADEAGNPGSILTFFEFPAAAPGRAGAGMIHRIGWRVGSEASLDFWSRRLSSEGVEAERGEGRVRFSDPEGLELELIAAPAGSRLAADAPGILGEHALLGFAGVSAYSGSPGASEDLLVRVLGFVAKDADACEVGAARYAYQAPPAGVGAQGAGTVHHIAWASPPSDHAHWHRRLQEAGAHPTEIIDRLYFRSIYFREPAGVLFEIATIGPGFTVDESIERLGASLVLPPWHEHLRSELEKKLTPLLNPGEEVVRR